MKKIALVMAGGFGMRIWPRSTEKKPKQFIHLNGEGTMIQNTVNRLHPMFSNEEIFIVTTEEFVEFIEDQLPAIPKENIILEPFGRGTAPCLALSVTAIQDRLSPDTVMFAFPSDQVIYNIREYQQSLELAQRVAYEKKAIVTIGITPTRPETGYGYIQVKEEIEGLGELHRKGTRLTRTFAEKPDVETAKRFIEAGDFFWNSGIFIWTIDTFWKSFNQYLPEHQPLFKLLNKHIGKDTFDKVVKHIYHQMESVSVDYAILEKSDNVLCVQSSFSWSDLANWDEVFRLSLKDARNNFIEGDVIAIDTSNCLVSSNGKMIGVVGVDDLIVIDSDDALLICKRKNSESVKELVDFLRRKNINRYL